MKSIILNQHHSNDFSFVYTAMALAEKITWIKKTLVTYRLHPTSVSHNKENYPECFVSALKQLAQNLQAHNLYDTVERSFINLICSFTLWHYNNVFSENAKKKIVNLAKELYYDYNLEFRSPEYFYQKNEILTFLNITSKQPYISIVVPIYNNDKYLRECIESIITQTLKNIEVILVDDGSSDKSPQICDEYAEKDYRIKVIHKKNAGMGAAYNSGIKAACGKYIGFVESDDYISSQMCEELYNLAETNNVDVLKTDYNIFVGDGDKREFSYKKVVKNTNNYYNCLISPQYDIDVFKTDNVIWNGLYKHSFIIDNNIHFNETLGASYQDNGFYFQTYCFAKKMWILDKAFYQLRRDNPNSSVKSKEKVFCICDEYDFIEKILNKHPIVKHRIYPMFLLRKYYNYMWTLNRVGDEFKLMFLKRFARDFKKITQRDDFYNFSFFNA